MNMLKKEHLLNYMLRGHVHLSKKDYSFFNNLVFLVKDKKYVTTNQDKLFDKLIRKYQRQLNKLGYNLEDLEKLTWSAEVISSLEEYLVPKISLTENDSICLRAPYKTAFLSEFRSQKDNTYIWDRIHKLYRSPFYTHALRAAIELSSKHFDKVQYCDRISQLLQTVQTTTSTEPTLVLADGVYSIENMNAPLAEAVKDIALNGDYKTVFQLSTYGVAIDEKIINNDPIMRLASKYHSSMDLDTMFDHPEYFTALGVTDVYFPLKQRANNNTAIDKEILNFFKQNQIKVHLQLDSVPDTVVYIKRSIHSMNYFSEKLDRAMYQKIAKIIQILNSRPIDIK